jgi:aminopeptidase N
MSTGGPQALRILVATFMTLVTGAIRAATPSIELDVDLDPGSRRFHAAAVIEAPARDFRFELHESLKVTNASVDGEPLRVVPAGRDGPVAGWRVQMPAGAGRLRIEYGGTLPSLDRSLDDRAVLRGLPPMASTEGSFLPAASAWYPAPAALFSYRVTVSVPGDQRVVVPGRLESETLPRDPGDRYRAGFAFAHLASGIDLMAGPWIIGERIVPRASGAPLRLRTYFFRELDAIAGLSDGYLDDSRRYLDRYANEIGDYPFTEFSVVASPLPTGFAMPTLTYIGAEVLKLPFIRATSLGHEVLHNWWGNGVYVDYAAGNWSEGLTTFMADYAGKERDSAEAAREMRLAWLRDFAAAPGGGRETLASFRTRTHGAAAAVGYGKSAMLFVMLRDTIGEDAFRRGIRTFWEREQFRTASWSDLQAAFEHAAGRSLASFFDQWVNRAGAPAVTIADARAKVQAGKVRLTLAVLQVAPAYALRLPLEVVYRDRTEMHIIDIDRLRNVATTDVLTMPDGVRLDPALRVWRVLEPAQVPPILRQWITARAPRLAQASDVMDVRDAALALAKRLFESAPQSMSPEALNQGREPVLLVGLHAEIDAALVHAGLPPRPSILAGRGSAQVWTVSRVAGAPVAVVSADDAAALRALLAPLPHYGAQSWLVFEGRRALDRGVWPAPGSLVAVQRDR